MMGLKIFAGEEVVLPGLPTPDVKNRSLAEKGANLLQQFKESKHITKVRKVGWMTSNGDTIQQCMVMDL